MVCMGTPWEEWSLPETPEALLIIDVQVGLIADPDIVNGAEVLRKIHSLIVKAHAQDKPVLYMQHEASDPGDLLRPGHDEWNLHPDIAPMPCDIVLRKHSSDSFLHTDLDAILTQLGVRHIAVAGCATDYCVDTTCRSALKWTPLSRQIFICPSVTTVPPLLGLILPPHS